MFLFSKEERILEIFAELFLCSVIALIARDLSLEIKESIDLDCISGISFVNPCNFFNSVLERFDLIKDLFQPNNSITKLFQVYLQQFYNQEYQYFQD